MSLRYSKKVREFRVFNEIIFDRNTKSLREANVSSPLYVRFSSSNNVAHCHLGREIVLNYADSPERK